MRPLMEKREGVNFFKGIIFLCLLLFYHSIEFFLTMSMGIGVGILAAVIHYNFWYRELDPFWQTYITLIFIFLVTELYFRMSSRTRFSKWIDRTQQDYLLLLYFIPRGLYFILYIVTIVSLFLQYKSVHKELYVHLNSTLQATPKSPLNLELDDDHYFRTILFVISLSYMMYVLTKESDWMTHRLQVMATGDDDPIAKGSIGSFIVLTGTHTILTAIYFLPIVGFVFIFKTFVGGWEETYFIICPLSAAIGILTSILERQALFPNQPMLPPNYAYENHLRVRVGFLHYWLIPLAAGRYFNRSKATVLNATDGDFLVFTMEVAIGVLQASKVIANDVYILWYAPKPAEPTQEESIQVPELLEVNSEIIGEDEEETEYYSPNKSLDEFGLGSNSSGLLVPKRTSEGELSIKNNEKPVDPASVHDLMKRIV